MKIIHVFWDDGSDAYVATFTNYPSISGLGDTPEDALREFRIAEKLAREAIAADSALEELA